MLLTGMALKSMIGTIALMALLAVAFGAVIRAKLQPVVAQVGLGALFGAAAILAMFDPLAVAPGVVVDLRNVPVVLAGAFLSFPGAAVATGLAVLMRAEMGGVGMSAGIAGIVVAAISGLAWAFAYRRQDGRTWRRIMPLAAGSCLYAFSVFLLPSDVAVRMVSTVWPFIVPFHGAGVLVVGALLERERRLVSGERHLSRAATRDPLTGLLNRRGFEADVGGAPQGSWGSALLMLDLDRLKLVNDQHGHAAGDVVLRSLAPRLRYVLGDHATIARFGGEEIVIYLPEVGPNIARTAAKRLCAAIRSAPFVLADGTPLAITASVGGAWAEAPACLDDLLRRADVALREAKRAGRDGWHIQDNEAPIPPEHRRSAA